MNCREKNSGETQCDSCIRVYRQYIGEDAVPCMILVPAAIRGGAVVNHGYGGSKEEQMGLAWRLAEKGMAVCVPDLRGHGENHLLFGADVLADVETAVRFTRQFGQVVVIGHSLGGRLSLVSSGDYHIGISPALGSVFSDQTRELIQNIRQYRVRDDGGEFLKEFRQLPFWTKRNPAAAMLIYGSRDIPEIVGWCREAEQEGIPVVQVENALHSDIFIHEKTYAGILAQLEKWFAHRPSAGETATQTPEAMNGLLQ